MLDGRLAPEAWVPLRVFLTRSPKPRHVVDSGTALSDVRQGTACCMLFAARESFECCCNYGGDQHHEQEARQVAWQTQC